MTPTARNADHPPDPLPEQYERLLALRLISVVEAFDNDTPYLTRTSGFPESWSVVERLPPGFLDRTVRQPLLDDWVSSAERLVRCGAHVRYPEAHPIRHLKDFSRLLLSWASLAPDRTEGIVPVLGRRTFPLLFGKVLIRQQEPSQDGLVTWEVRSGALRVHGKSRSTMLEFDLSDFGHWASSSGWDVLHLPYVDGILIDLWSPEYVGERERPMFVADLTRALGRSLAQLEDGDLRFVSAYLRGMTLHVTGCSWIAGLARVTPPFQTMTPASLLELTYRDRIERLLKVFQIQEKDWGAAFVNFSDLRRLLVELGAKVATCHHLGLSVPPKLAQKWGDLLSILQSAPGSEVLVRELGEGKHAEAGTKRLKPPTLTLEPTLRHAGIDPAALPPNASQLRKTRREARDEVDWSTIDGLSRLPCGSLERLCCHATARAYLSERDAFCGAVSSYLTGQFAATRECLRLCLRFDQDVEQYWLLLAFTLRHLGQRDGFSRIVFDGLRDISSL